MTCGRTDPSVKLIVLSIVTEIEKGSLPSKFKFPAVNPDP